MPYIGNPIYQSAFVTDQFSGNGSTTAFTMSVAPAGVSNVLVAVSGVLQDPSTYSVVGNTITFSAAPPSGTGNISCRYLGVPASGVTTTAYRTVTEFTATASQTTFTPPSYTVGFINVYLNGVLLGSADYTASNGTTVVLATGASAGNLLTVESFLVSSVLNAIPNTAGAVTSSNIQSGVTINFADGSASTPSVTNDGDTNTGMFFPAADTIAFTEGGTESMRIDSSGNVGIGTTSPSQRLTVRTSGTSTSVGGNIAARIESNGSGYASTLQFSDNVANSAYISMVGSATAFGQAGTEAMRINSSGNVLVGNNIASPSISGNLGFINLASTANTETQITWAKATQVEAHAGFKTSTDSNFYVNTGGALGTFGVYLTNTGTSWTSNSDERLKENLTPIVDATNKVSQLRAVIGNYINDESKKARPFLIAQDVQAVLPEAVSVNTDELGTLGVSYTDVIPLLVAAIQELNAKVEAQAVRIAELEGAAQ
jgi:hypothetical protein